MVSAKNNQYAYNNLLVDMHAQLIFNFSVHQHVDDIELPYPVEKSNEPAKNFISELEVSRVVILGVVKKMEI